MKRFISGVLSLAIVAGTLVSAVSVGAAGVYSDEFNSVTEKSGSYYNWYFGSAADWSATNFTQGEFAGEKVLKGNVGAAKDLKMYQKIGDYDRVVVESEIGFPNADADRAFTVGIGPVTLNSANSRNYWDGVKIQQNGYVFMSGEAQSSSSKYQNGTLLKVGYAYDKAQNTVTYYSITNNKEIVNKKTVTLSNNNHTAVKLEGAALSIRGNGNYLGEGYWNYIHVDTPEAMAVESVSPSENSNAVSTSKAVRIKFNNIIDPDNMGDISFKSADGADVAASVKIYDGRTLVITPSSALAENTAYTVSVSAVKDLFGSAADASTSFTTGDKYHIHYDFDDVTAKSGHYFSQGTGNAAAMTWKQDTVDGRQVLNGTVSAASEALSFENLPDMDNVICELSAALPAANPAYQIGMRPVGNLRQWTGGVRMTRTQYFLLDGSAADKNQGFAVTWGKFYRIGFGYNKATKTATYYVIGNNGTTYTKEVAMNGDYLQGASVYLRGDSASAQTGYYDYLYIDKAEKLEAKDVKTLNSGIRAEYNNVLVPSGIKAVYKDDYGNEAEGTVSVSNGNILSVTAPSELKAGRIYTLTVSGIKDVSGLESKNIVRDVKMSAVKGYVQNFEQFSGQTFKGGDADKTIDGVMFRTSEYSTDIEMATVDAEHGTSAKINAVEDLAGGASQIWFPATYSNVHKKVVGFSVYMPAPDSKAAFYFRVMDTDGKLSGISSLQEGRVFFNNESRSWYMNETNPRWHDIRYLLDFDTNQYHLIVDGEYVRSDKIDVTANNIRYMSLSAAKDIAEIYVDNFVCYDTVDFEPDFSVNEGVANVNFGQEVSNIAVSTTEDIALSSEYGSNPTSASFAVEDGAVLSVRTLDGIYHRYTYENGSFKECTISEIEYIGNDHHFAGASGLTDNLTVNVKVINTGSAAVSVPVAIYDYDTDKIVAVKLVKAEFADGEASKTVTCEFTDLGFEGKNEEGSKRASCIKTFVLDGMDNLKPVDKAVVWNW